MCMNMSSYVYLYWSARVSAFGSVCTCVHAYKFVLMRYVYLFARTHAYFQVMTKDFHRKWMPQ